MNGDLMQLSDEQKHDELGAYVEETMKLRAEIQQWKAAAAGRTRQWNAALDELTATKGEVARLRGALERAWSECADGVWNTAREFMEFRCRLCGVEVDERNGSANHKENCAFAALTAPARRPSPTAPAPADSTRRLWSAAWMLRRSSWNSS